jgi:hypothetical protein
VEQPLIQNQDEIILAQEQGVINKPRYLGIAADLQGTLVLTNKRLIFVCNSINAVGVIGGVSTYGTIEDKIAKESANLGVDFLGESAPRTYTDVDDLSKIPSNEKNLFVQISSMGSVSGHKGIVGRPNLKVSWNDSSGEVKNTEFQESLTERSRKKNLSDWAEVIQKLKDGTLSPRKPVNMPESDSVEGQIYYIMGDMQTKGSLEIEEETEKKFEIELEPEEVETVCEKLASMGLLDKIPDPTGDSFYKKRSPLGEDDLSS